jgi:hypothetical protein
LPVPGLLAEDGGAAAHVVILALNEQATAGCLYGWGSAMMLSLRRRGCDPNVVYSNSRRKSPHVFTILLPCGCRHF